MADGFQAAREKAVSPGGKEEPGRAPGAETRATEDEEMQPEGEGESSQVKLLSVPVKPSQKMVSTEFFYIGEEDETTSPLKVLRIFCFVARFWPFSV